MAEPISRTSPTDEKTAAPAAVGALGVLGGELSPLKRMDFVLGMMREMSTQTDPQGMVGVYRKWMRHVVVSDTYVGLSRRGLERPYFRVTRAESLGTDFDPWREPQKIPLLQGGLLSELIWGEEPVVIDDLELPESDPAHPFLRGMRSLVAVPLFDGGKSLNMSIVAWRRPAAFDRRVLPELVWISNLFGRAAYSQVLRTELKSAYDVVDRELRVVADIQHALLPARLPTIACLDVSAYYRTSERSGGDYYDFFPLPGAKGEPAGQPGSRWGVLLADVSGHGTPAAVLMAITHSIAHLGAVPPGSPKRMLQFINQNLAARYTMSNGRFVTAFYGVWDPQSRTLHYANAGHPPPLVRGIDGSVKPIPGAMNFPLGIEHSENFVECDQKLAAGEALVLFTDGITEARRGVGADLYGDERLRRAIGACKGGADAIVECVLNDVQYFTDGAPPNDDRTLLVMKTR